MAEYGTNTKPPPERHTFFQFCWEALDDATLRILLFCGVISLFLGIFYDDHPTYGWIDGFAIILAVVIVVVVTGTNDYQKQKRFIAL
jgi:magnesium-transporting ATPase (P-type)